MNEAGRGYSPGVTCLDVLERITLVPDTPPQGLPEKPLAEASLRLAQMAHVRHGMPKADVDTLHRPSLAAGLAAAGASDAKIAEVVGVNRQTVSRELLPHRDRILAIRDKLKLRKMVRMARVETRLWPRLEKETVSGDAKSVDALARAAMNLEKMQAQVSGEGQQVTLRTESNEPLVDLKILIQNLLGPSS